MILHLNFGAHHLGDSILAGSKFMWLVTLRFVSEAEIMHFGVQMVNFNYYAIMVTNQVTVTIDDANGNIGIGTDNAGAPLHVFGSSDVTSLIDAAAGDALLNIRNAGDGNWRN